MVVPARVAVNLLDSQQPGCAQLMRWGIPQHVLYLGLG